jgi:hypothetical protein
MHGPLNVKFSHHGDLEPGSYAPLELGILDWYRYSAVLMPFRTAYIKRNW